MRPAIKLALESAHNADRWITKESQFQECVAKLLDSLGLFWCHVPNGGQRDKRTAVALKRQGVKPGVPDVMIFEPWEGETTKYGWTNVEQYTGCAIELKYGKNKPTFNQMEWLDQLSKNGWYTNIAYSMADVIAILGKCGYLEQLEAK